MRWISGFLSTMFGGLRQIAGIQTSDPRGRTGVRPAAHVNFDTAMQVSAFWACARLIAETVGGLPPKVYAKGDTNMQPLTDHWLAQLLDRPHPEWTTQELFEFRALCLSTNGNAYSHIIRRGDGQPKALEQLMPAQMEVRLETDGRRRYFYQDQKNGSRREINPADMWHARLFGNGLIGMAPLSFAAHAAGIAIAMENRVSATMLNGAKPTGVLMADKVLNDKQREQFRTAFKSLAEGNEDSLIVLEAGLKYQQVSMSPQDIELLTSRKFQTEDIARFMGVPSILINDASASSVWGTGIDAIIRGWYGLGLRPYIIREQQTCQRALLGPNPSKANNVEVCFDLDALLMGDPEKRATANQQRVNSAQMTPNEARATERRPALPGGDTLLVNSTLIPLATALARAAAPIPNPGTKDPENQQ